MKPPRHPLPELALTTPGSAPDRRTFLLAAGALASGTALGTPAPASAADDSADKAVAALYESLTAAQRKATCFDWDEKGGCGGRTSSPRRRPASCPPG